MRVAANLSMMFQEVGGLLQRYEAAAQEGFKYVECAFPYDEKLNSLRETIDKCNLQQILINAPPGNWSDGSRGLACLPDKKVDFRESIQTAIDYAKGLKCSRIHVMAGISPSEQLRVAAEQCYVENVKYAAQQMEKEGITCLIEPINGFSIPGYFLFSLEQALRYLEEIKQPNLKIQLDIFHAQLISGKLTDTIKRILPHCGHIQVAQAPDRHEPHTDGEINYGYVFELLRKLGYDDFIGAEYIPAKDTTNGLEWIRKYGLFIN